MVTTVTSSSSSQGKWWSSVERLNEVHFSSKKISYDQMYCHQKTLLMRIPTLLHRLYEAESFDSQHIEPSDLGNEIFVRDYPDQGRPAVMSAEFPVPNYS